MPAPSPTTTGPASRGSLFWSAVLSLIAVQLMGLFMVCSQQVRKAQARQTAFQVQQMAFSDCLQYVNGSTIGSCTSRIGWSQGAAVPHPGGDPAEATSGTAPVNMVLR